MLRMSAITFSRYLTFKTANCNLPHHHDDAFCVAGQITICFLKALHLENAIADMQTKLGSYQQRTNEENKNVTKKKEFEWDYSFPSRCLSFYCMCSTRGHSQTERQQTPSWRGRCFWKREQETHSVHYKGNSCADSDPNDDQKPQLETRIWGWGWGDYRKGNIQSLHLWGTLLVQVCDSQGWNVLAWLSGV